MLRPNDNYLIISFDELLLAWAALASPEKQHLIDDTISTLKALNATTVPARTVFSMVAATAWLTADGEVAGSRSSVG